MALCIAVNKDTAPAHDRPPQEDFASTPLPDDVCNLHAHKHAAIWFAGVQCKKEDG